MAKLAFDIPSFRDVFKGDWLRNGQWVVACIEGGIAWPTSKQDVSFKGQTLHIIPVTQELYPAVALQRTVGLSAEEAERVISRFLSALSWMTEQGVGVAEWTRGNLPRPMGRQRSHSTVRDKFDFANLPDTDDEKFELALALLREARFINQPAYAFLSAFRVIETNLAGKKNLVDWINNNVGSISGYRAVEILKGLQKIHSDIGGYLYEEGRCSVAHANRQPVVSPDDPTDQRRLRNELPLVIALATRLIETEYEIETGHTIYQKHLYELAGFKKLFGEDVVHEILSGAVPSGTVPIPPIDVGLREQPPYEALRELLPTSLIVAGGVVQLTLEAENRPIAMQFRLNFPEERLEFDVTNDFIFGDSGTAEGAEHVAQIKEFLFEYFANGSLQLTAHETGEVVARKDPFIPVNVMLNVKAAKADIQKWRDESEARRRGDGPNAPGGDESFVRIEHNCASE